MLKLFYHRNHKILQSISKVIWSQVFRAKFNPLITTQRSYLVCPTHSVHCLFLWTQILTNHYASSFPSHANYSFNGKIPETYLYKVKVQEPGLIHETCNQFPLQATICMHLDEPRELESWGIPFGRMAISSLSKCFTCNHYYLKFWKQSE